MIEPLVVRRETQIAAPPATVFAFLTDPEKILSWMGAEATTEAHPGGLYLVKGIGSHANGARSIPRGRAGPSPRLQLRLGGKRRGAAGIEPGRDRPYRAGRRHVVRMTHSGLPDATQVAYHDRGWAHYLGRLAIAAAGRDPGIDHGPPPRES